ncbi:MAG TPA: hypothetical protein VFV19_13660 [Candidatus Polarisedimenticolaceae bacterium]|nr:hypothetical protein [Candidatus Polarisedimenticolaceae bacterium]
MRVIVVVFLTAFILACGFFPDSNFMLSPESRLPRWFHPPADVPRSDLSVELFYYYDHATFVLRNERTGRQLAKIRAHKIHKDTLYLPNSRRADGVMPTYTIMMADGIVEVVEHRRVEPVFDISDDPDVRAKLLTMTGNEALLKK